MNTEKIINELQFHFTRSSGAGGQHVNKVSTKVVLNFDVENSIYLSEEERELLFQKLENRISKEGILILSSGATRSQLKNKELVIKRFLDIIKGAVSQPKKRKPTKRPKSADLIRLEKKKNLAKKKANRKKPKF